MKNSEIISSINQLSAFLDRQRSVGTSLLSVTGQFAIKHNLKVLNENYKTYEETLNDIKAKHKVEDKVILSDYTDEARKEVEELLNIDVEGIELKTITEIDFKDGATFDDITILDFMIKEEN